MRFPSTLQAVTLFFFTISTTAQTTNTTLTSTGCYDANSFTTCSETAAGKAQVCNAAAVAENSELALSTCGCVYYVEMMNCYMANCWNRVYQCEYQEYAIQYISECPSGAQPQHIPFFPPPDHAPASCSCNLGNLYFAVNASENQGAACVADVVKAALPNDPITTANMEEACACCAESGAISAFYNICPSSLPSLIGIDEVYRYIAELQVSWSTCSPYMSAYGCTTELNFTNVAGTFYTPENLPPSGTGSLSVLAGTVPAPPSGTLFSYTNYFDSTVYTITAAVDGKPAGVGGVTVVTAGVPTDTVTEPIPTITLKSAADTFGKYRSWVLANACVLVGVRLLL